MKYPYLDINIDKIEQNTRKLTALCRKKSIEVAGVTKVVCGMPKVARAMLRGGVKQLADSRMENIHRMRQDGIKAEIMLLRLPMLSEVDQIVKEADISLNSELKVIKALSAAALKAGIVHRVVLMVDVGDLREGVLPSDTLKTARNILKFKGVELHGIGTNLACLSGIQPDKKNMELLVYIADELRKRLSILLPIVSGGNTFSLPSLVKGMVPKGINHFRLGGSLILSASPTPEDLDLRNDTIRLHAEVLELKDKPSAPYGKTGKDAFGKKPKFTNKGMMRRAILGVGKEDINPRLLFPVDKKVKILGASSDHLIVDVSKIGRRINVGDAMEFELEYGAVLAAMTSKYVHKNIIYKSSLKKKRKKLSTLGVPAGGEKIIAADELRKKGLMDKIREAKYVVSDEGNLEGPADVNGISGFVSNNIKEGVVPLVIGGPHEIIMPELAGVKSSTNEFGLICFDAHGDLITASMSGPHKNLPLSYENFVIIGVRSLTKEEKVELEKSSLKVFTMEEIDRLGISVVMGRAIALACRAVDGVHVSLDMDFVDYKDAPGVFTPEPGGLNYREAHCAMELIAESKRLISMDITEIDPALDPSGATVKLGISLLATLLGKRLLDRN